MDRIGRGAAAALLGALAAAFTVAVAAVPAADHEAMDPEDAAMLEAGQGRGAAMSDQEHGAAIIEQHEHRASLDAEPSGCTVATADRATTGISGCTGCHAGLGQGGRANMMQMPGHDFGHPVDIDFDAARSAHPDAYHSRDQLPAFLPLASGKITCLTCHDGRTGNRHSLAKASQKELCLACHKM